jgi:hypothetical protein
LRFLTATAPWHQGAVKIAPYANRSTGAARKGRAAFFALKIELHCLHYDELIAGKCSK